MPCRDGLAIFLSSQGRFGEPIKCKFSTSCLEFELTFNSPQQERSLSYPSTCSWRQITTVSRDWELCLITRARRQNGGDCSPSIRTFAVATCLAPFCESSLSGWMSIRLVGYRVSCWTSGLGYRVSRWTSPNTTMGFKN